MNKLQLTAVAMIASLTVSLPVQAKDSNQATKDSGKILVNQLDSKKEITYNCINNGKPQKLNVMYGIKNGEIVVAQAKVNNVISKGLWRSPNTLMNVFESRESDGTIWTTMPATPATLGSVDGGKLSVNKNGSNAIILEQCSLSKS